MTSPFENLFSNLEVPSGLVCDKQNNMVGGSSSTKVFDTPVVPRGLYDNLLDNATVNNDSLIH